MPIQRLALAVAVAATPLGTVAGGAAYAQSASESVAEIATLKRQLRLLEQKLDQLQKQTAANTTAAAKANAKADAKVAVTSANAAYAVKGPVPSSGVVVKMPNNRPTFCTADEMNCISITSRLHFDVGGYDYRPNSASTNPQQLDNGVNARRARIGLLGTFLGDWNYALIYDFGGSSDGFATTNVGATGGVSFLPGGALSGIENAYVSYTGFKPFGGKLAIEGGYLDVLYTLGEAMSSNDMLFMERASSLIIATNIAAGDARAAFGARWYNDVFWMGSYVTGPTAGALHSFGTSTTSGATEQYGATVRAAGQLVSGKDYSLHIGAGAEFLFKPPVTKSAAGVLSQTLTLSDRPELRIDPTSIISTGAMANISGAQVYSVEAAASYGPLFLQGEYFWYNVQRQGFTGLPDLRFNGGYAEASYVLTGETRSYNAGTGAYGGIAPARPFSWADGGWGAWEIAGRISMMDLDDQLGTASGAAGGRQLIYTAALNWYASRNIRFMLNYLHGNIDKQVNATNSSDAGAKFNAVAMRTQVAF